MNIDNTTLDALRPQPVELDADWSEATLRSILATDQQPARQRSPRRRSVLTAVAVAAASFGGVGVAAASTGFSLSSFTEAFSYWKDAPGKSVDPAEAKRLATAPGPSGSTFSVISSGEGYACFTAIIESPTSAEKKIPTAFTDVTDNYCSDRPIYSDNATFGQTGVSYGSEIAGYMAVAAEAVRAEATTTDGTTYPALLVDGMFWGWFPKDEHLTLTGYAEDGAVVGAVVLN